MNEFLYQHLSSTRHLNEDARDFSMSSLLCLRLVHVEPNSVKSQKNCPSSRALFLVHQSRFFQERRSQHQSQIDDEPFKNCSSRKGLASSTAISFFFPNLTTINHSTNTFSCPNWVENLVVRFDGFGE